MADCLCRAAAILPRYRMRARVSPYSLSSGTAVRSVHRSSDVRSRLFQTAHLTRVLSPPIHRSAHSNAALLGSFDCAEVPAVAFAPCRLTWVPGRRSGNRITAALSVADHASLWCIDPFAAITTTRYNTEEQQTIVAGHEQQNDRHQPTNSGMARICHAEIFGMFKLVSRDKGRFDLGHFAICSRMVSAMPFMWSQNAAGRPFSLPHESAGWSLLKRHS
jgi:hypothetical protein